MSFALGEMSFAIGEMSFANGEMNFGFGEMSFAFGEMSFDHFGWNEFPPKRTKKAWVVPIFEKVTSSSWAKFGFGDFSRWFLDMYKKS